MILGSKNGEVIEMSEDENMVLKESMCIRIAIDIWNPLETTITLKIIRREIIKLPVKYERLPTFSFHEVKLGMQVCD